ncbi:MAG: hypothetical protein HOB73_03935 [Planctomycetaceae bacterium]|jgi:hypothetical protein|nr:hypothetical protein [Planctomycetaceae bacterium]
MAKTLTILLLLLLVYPHQSLHGQVSLAPQVPTTGTFKIEHSFELSQLIVLDDKDYQTTQQQTKTTLHQVSKPNTDGYVTITETVEQLKNSTRLPGDIQFTYDSTASKAEVPLFDAIRDSTITTQIDQSGNIFDLIIDSTFATLPEETQTLVFSELDPTTVKKRRQQVLSQYHIAPVKINESWDQVISIPLSHNSQFLFKTTHTYSAKTEHPTTKKMLHQVTVEFHEGAFTRNTETFAEGDPITIVEAAKSYWFDSHHGRISKSSVNLSLTGDITFKMKRTKTTAHLTLDIKRSWQIP